MDEELREKLALEVQQAMLIEGDAYTIAKEATDAILLHFASVRVREQREAYIAGVLRDRGTMSEDWMETLREEAAMIYLDPKGGEG